MKKKRNFKAGPDGKTRYRWQIFAKNATIQLDQWTRVQRSNFSYFLNLNEDHLVSIKK
jgi:hypothetical protein